MGSEIKRECLEKAIRLGFNLSEISKLSTISGRNVRTAINKMDLLGLYNAVANEEVIIDVGFKGSILYHLVRDKVMSLMKSGKRFFDAVYIVDVDECALNYDTRFNPSEAVKRFRELRYIQ